MRILKFQRMLTKEEDAPCLNPEEEEEHEMAVFFSRQGVPFPTCATASDPWRSTATNTKVSLKMISNQLQWKWPCLHQLNCDIYP